MSYNVEELFRFQKTESGYALAEYLKKDDPTVTELEIPAEHNGLPVTVLLNSCFSSARHLKHVSIPESVRFIAAGAFRNCSSLETAELSEGIEIIGRCAFEETGLKSVRLPKSLIKLGSFSFSCCPELESVEFGGTPPDFRTRVFHNCKKLPPEISVMGLTRSTDITSRIGRTDYRGTIDGFAIKECDSFSADVFEILAKNKCYRKLNVKFLFEKMINENRHDLLLLAEKYGMLDSAVLLDLLISYAVKQKNIELTAYLLDLKNRKFGFKKGGDLDL